jgi:hypothetical protein
LLSANSLPRSAPSLASRICALVRKSETFTGSVRLALAPRTLARCARSR